MKISSLAFALAGTMPFLLSSCGMANAKNESNSLGDLSSVSDLMNRPTKSRLSDMFTEMRRSPDGPEYLATFTNDARLSSATMSFEQEAGQVAFIRLYQRDISQSKCIRFYQAASQLQWIIQPSSPEVHEGDNRNHGKYAYAVSPSRHMLASLPSDYPCVSYIQFEYK